MYINQPFSTYTEESASLPQETVKLRIGFERVTGKWEASCEANIIWITVTHLQTMLCVSTGSKTLEQKTFDYNAFFT
jgi:hypothetical protein